jgi:hypothetical protein
MNTAIKPVALVGGSNAVLLKLSPQEFGKILDALRSSAAAGGSDKRLFNRMAVEANLSLASLLDGQVNRVYNALTRDISVNGIGLLQALPLTRGDTFLAAFPLGKEEMVVKCKATFCRRLAEGIFGIGAEFAAKVDPVAMPNAKQDKVPETPAPSSVQ